MPASQTRRQPNNVDKASSRRKKTHKNATPRLSPRKVPDGMDAEIGRAHV